MAYKAYLNNTQLFFDSSLQDDNFLLTSAVLQLDASSAGDFTFTIPSCNQYYDSFVRLKSYVDVWRDDERIFFGRVYSIQQTFDAQKKISCEGLLAVLADSIFRPIEYEGRLHALVRQIINSHNAQVGPEKGLVIGTLSVSDSDVYRPYQTYDKTISRLSDLCASFGGYMMITKEFNPDTTGIVDIDLVDEAVVDTDTGTRLTFHWISDFTDACTQKIELTSNLIDITQSVDSEDIITVLIPTGAVNDEGNRLTIAEVNNGLDYIVAADTYIEQYGYIVGSKTWSDVNYANILKTKAQNYLDEVLRPKTTINLSAVDLADAGYDVDSFRIGQKVTVKSVPHGINNLQFNCQEQKLNLLHPENNRLMLGDVKRGFVESNRYSNTRLLEEVQNSFATKGAVAMATQLITGNSGGFVVFHDGDGDGYPDEILVMDTPDVTTAVKIWRWNKQGLGYSSSGYNGPFGLAMTIDGSIVANFITSGQISGDRVRAGYIESENGTSYWDLDNDKFSCANAEILGGSINIVTDSGTKDVIELNYLPSSGYIQKNRFSPSSLRVDSNSTNGYAYSIFSYRGFGCYGGTDESSAKLQADLTASQHGAVYNQRYDGNNRLQLVTNQNYGQATFFNTSGSLLINISAASGVIQCVSLTQTSDENAKNSIADLDKDKSAEFIYKLNPVSFRYNDNPVGTHHGVTTQNVQRIIQAVYGDSDWDIVTEPDGNNYEDNPNPYKSLAYTELIADLIATVQSQNERIKALEQRLGGE